jgi:hypothetical protein
VTLFVAAMKAGEEGQLEAFAGFIADNAGMHQALVAKDWQTFARFYNGPGAVAAYSAKIAAAYARRSAQAPTVPIPVADPNPPVPDGYRVQPSGNIVREDVKQSSIVKGTDLATKVTAAAGTAAVAAPAVGAVAGMDWKALLGVAAVLLAGALAFAVWKLVQAKTARIEMNKQGIA